jgi:hypothetical protein
MFFTLIIAFGILANALPLSSSTEVIKSQMFHLSRILSRTYSTANSKATIGACPTVVPTIQLPSLTRSVIHTSYTMVTSIELPSLTSSVIFPSATHAASATAVEDNTLEAGTDNILDTTDQAVKKSSPSYSDILNSKPTSSALSKNVIGGLIGGVVAIFVVLLIWLCCKMHMK